MKVVVVSCTQSKSQEDTLIYKSYHENLRSTCTELIVKTNNKTGLSEQYNVSLGCFKKTDADWLVLVHDDVYIDDMRLVKKLDDARKLGYDIVGLAGCLEPRIVQYNLWHIMAEKKNLRGIVFHPCNKEGQIMSTCFGPTPSRVAIIDGLFIAIHIPSVKNNDWKFNENYKFHHYDISSCIDANKHKLKIGVMPINVIHTSPGLASVEDKNWSESNKRFIKEYGG
jgi:hypothetical protein